MCLLKKAVESYSGSITYTVGTSAPTDTSRHLLSFWEWMNKMSERNTGKWIISDAVLSEISYNRFIHLRAQLTLGLPLTQQLRVSYQQQTPALPSSYSLSPSLHDSYPICHLHVPHPLLPMSLGLNITTWGLFHFIILYQPFGKSGMKRILNT